jgi:hypothetical protein
MGCDHLLAAIISITFTAAAAQLQLCASKLLPVLYLLSAAPIWRLALSFGNTCAIITDYFTMLSQSACKFTHTNKTESTFCSTCRIPSGHKTPHAESETADRERRSDMAALENEFYFYMQESGQRGERKAF